MEHHELILVGFEAKMCRCDNWDQDRQRTERDLYRELWVVREAFDEALNYKQLMDACECDRHCKLEFHIRGDKVRQSCRQEISERLFDIIITKNSCE